MADTVKVQVRTNGPFLISGAVELVDADGNAWDLAGKDDIRPVPMRSLEDPAVL